MRVRDLMSPEPVVVSPTTPAAECRQLLRECGFRNLPVVRDGALLGLLTDGLAWGAQPEGATASDLMVPAQVSARADEPLHDVLARCTWAMQEAVVVLDAQGNLAGILTEHDAVRLASKVLPAHETVEAWATTSLVCIDDDRPAAEALDRMRRAFLRHLVVLDDRRLRGIVSLRDLLAERAEERPELTAGEVVRGPVQWTVGWDTPLREAAGEMVRHGVGCLPVVSDEGHGRVEAVISRTDVIRALLRSGAVGEPDRTPSPAEPRP